jgi:hypothetical protein
MKSKITGPFELMDSIPGWYENAWWDYFPLQAFDFHSGSHILLLNSVAPFVDLLGSAWGDLGHLQVARLEKLLSESSARHIIILVHHAPFRWDDEPPPGWAWGDLQRWACLAAMGPATFEFVNLLEKTCSADHKVAVFCGHRHGGVHHEARLGVWVGGEIAEGASIGESSQASLLCALLDPHQRLELGRMRGLPVTSQSEAPDVADLAEQH